MRRWGILGPSWMFFAKSQQRVISEREGMCVTAARQIDASQAACPTRRVGTGVAVWYWLVPIVPMIQSASYYLLGTNTLYYFTPFITLFNFMTLCQLYATLC